MLAGNHLPSCAVQALAYSEEMDVYDMPERAADIIESIAQKTTR